MIHYTAHTRPETTVYPNYYGINDQPPGAFPVIPGYGTPVNQVPGQPIGPDTLGRIGGPSPDISSMPGIPGGPGSSPPPGGAGNDTHLTAAGQYGRYAPTHYTPRPDYWGRPRLRRPIGGYLSGPPPQLDRQGQLTGDALRHVMRGLSQPRHRETTLSYNPYGEGPMRQETQEYARYAGFAPYDDGDGDEDQPDTAAGFSLPEDEPGMGPVGQPEGGMGMDPGGMPQQPLPLIAMLPPEVIQQLTMAFFALSDMLDQCCGQTTDPNGNPTTQMLPEEPAQYRYR